MFYKHKYFLMKANIIALCALLGLTTAHKLRFVDAKDDQFYSKVIGTMQVNAGDSEELSKDASKGVFSDQLATNVLRDITNGDPYADLAKKNKEVAATAYAKE